MNAIELYNQGRDFFEERQWKKAVGCFNRALRFDPAFADALFKRAEAYRHLGEEGKSILDYTEVINRDPAHFMAHYRRGKVYCTRDKPRYDLAMRDFNKAVRLRPDDSRGYRGRANVNYRTGKYSKVIGDCSRSLRLEPDCAFLHVLRGMSYLLEERSSSDDYNREMDRIAGKFEGAVESISRTVRKNSTSTVVIRPLQVSTDFRIPVDLGSAENQAAKAGRGATCSALEDFGKAILIEPIYSYAYWCRGNVYLENQLLDSAIVDFTQAVETAQGVADPYFSRGIAYYHKGWFGQAISDFDEAIARDIDCAEFYWWRGQAWESKGEGEKAREDFQKAAALGYEEDEES